jgi:superfamily II DNA or RNA helicase
VHLTLRFDAGTLVVDTDTRDAAAGLRLPDESVFDDRIGRWRAPADAYRSLFAWLHRQSEAGHLTYTDEARAYGPLGLVPRAVRTARPYQTEAVEAWFHAGRRGVIVLPTGAGKSWVARRIIERLDRAALVIVPTLDLMNQWYDGLLAAFELDDVGLLGGGYHDIRPLTVTTYDSAALHMDRYGDRFGLVVFDEVHHLPGPTRLRAAASSIAPFRLGLTATPERQDGRESELDAAVGPIVYRRGIKELAGHFLADYDVEQVTVSLTDEEADRYRAARATYLDFVRSAGIRFSSRDGWGRFIMLSSRSRDGRRAMRAYREQRRIALTCQRKLDLVEHLIAEHAQDRVLVFTNDNDTVYTLSRRLLVPSITHQTPTKERREILQRFNSGAYRVVVTSKVLNEGVDVPEAGVAIVLSGSGSVREHVQRLGRILRKRGDKRALLYEVVTADTVEERVSERRREHDAYR